MSQRTFSVYDILNNSTEHVEGVEALAKVLGTTPDLIPTCRIGGMIWHDCSDGAFGPERWRVIERSEDIQP